MQYFFHTLAGVALCGAALSGVVHVSWQLGLNVGWFEWFFANTLTPLWIAAIFTISSNQRFFTAAPPPWLKISCYLMGWYMILVAALFLVRGWPLKSTGFMSASGVVFYGSAALIFYSKTSSARPGG